MTEKSTDAKLLNEIKNLLDMSDAQVADLMGYNDSRAVRAIRHGEKNMSGPARVAATYLATGLLDEQMKLIVPEFSDATSPAGSEFGHTLFRHHFPRFIGFIHDNEMPGLENILIFPDPMYLTIVTWLDNPKHSDTDTIIKRAAAWVDEQYSVAE